MEATEICVWPGGLLVEHAASVARETGATVYMTFLNRPPCNRSGV